MFFSDDKEKSIKRILVCGMSILAICLLACMVHVADVRSAFEKEAKNNFSYQMFNSTQVLSSEFEKSLDALENASRDLSKQSYLLSERDIMRVLSEYKEHYSDVMYLNMAQKLYYSDGRIENIENNRAVQKIPKEDNKKIFLREREIDKKKKNYMIFFETVKREEKIQGYLIAYLDIENVFKEKSYQYLREIGYAFITDAKGRIVAATEGSETIVGKKDFFYDGLVSVVHQTSDNRLAVRNFQDKMKRTDKDEIHIKNQLGEKIYVAYQRIEEADGVYFIGCYNEDFVAKDIQPVIFRSALTCMIIIILMIIAILYVWASSKRANTTIEKIAFEDEVTKGKNLNYFKERASEIIFFNKEIPFLVERFDIVNFRYINEAYGHNRADEILRGAILTAEKIFLEKELCVRMDADQFLILAQNDGRCEQRRDDYVRVLNEYARSIGIKYPIRLKFGIYQVRKTDTELEVMIDRANVARKSITGKEKILQAYYSDSIVQVMRKIDKIESEMQKALDTEEFKVYLQPKWDIVKNELSGAEALARWVKVDKTTIMPGDFIPVFEKNGFIEKLDFYMLEKVCQVMREWLDSGIALVPVSINQSRVLLNSPDYTRNIIKILERYNIPKEFIELELTETVFMEERDTMIKIMRELKTMDIVLSMDDFGSGYSSLNMLKDIPFDVLKIDREFISESFELENSRWILQKVIEMAHGLGIRVICEGVETKEQIEVLKELGCRYVQGFYYAKPLPVEIFNKEYHGVIYELSE